MTDDKHLTYPGFDVSFLVPVGHDPESLEKAIARIKQDVMKSAARHLPEGSRLELMDTA